MGCGLMLKILMIEDNDDLRFLTAENLQRRGHEVVGLACAEELEDSALSGIDVFVFDLNLPGEDGISVTKRVRAVHPEVPIVIMTARSHFNDAIEGYESGADAYLRKPVSMDELAACIEGLCRKRKTLRPHLQLNGQQMSGLLGAVRLSAVESNLLTAFARSPNKSLEFWQISQILEVDTDQINKLNIAVRIDRLRKKITEAGCIGMPIESVRLLGYKATFEINIM